jgi:hypothetical protein
MDKNIRYMGWTAFVGIILLAAWVIATCEITLPDIIILEVIR